MKSSGGGRRGDATIPRRCQSDSGRLHTALTRFKELDAETSGEVGDPDPLQAIADTLRERPFDEIILSTLPPGASRWLRQDLPHRVERSFSIPVTHS